jgi:hypothetical protein
MPLVLAEGLCGKRRKRYPAPVDSAICASAWLLWPVTASAAAAYGGGAGRGGARAVDSALNTPKSPKVRGAEQDGAERPEAPGIILYIILYIYILSLPLPCLLQDNPGCYSRQLAVLRCCRPERGVCAASTQ